MRLSPRQQCSLEVRVLKLDKKMSEGVVYRMLLLTSETVALSPVRLVGQICLSTLKADKRNC